ncbi:MAG: hypothetical protein JXA67_03180 [Micromonosporaceae bacterium]|nr:hypothetical protein [Micromonosporaceae bacterium]
MDLWDDQSPIVRSFVSDWTSFWVICDDENCFLFFANRGGELFRSQTSIDLFPNAFDTPVVVITESPSNLWDAVEIYKIEGSERYLMITSAQGVTGRYLRAWISDRLDGDWSPYAGTAENPFAGASNVSFVEEVWTDDISHGEFVRHNVDQTMTLDVCGDLEYLYHGVDPTAVPSGNPTPNGDDHDSLPHRLGVLTPTGQPPVTARMPTGGAGAAGGAGGEAAVDLCPRDAGSDNGGGGAGGMGGAGGATPSSPTFQMVEDQVVIEAEHYAYRMPGSQGHLWTLVTDTAASNGERLDLLPNSGSIWPSNDLLNTPRVDYDVNFTSTGTFYFWVLGGGVHGGNDSCWGGVDCVIIASHFWPEPPGTDLVWASKTVTIDSPGIHSVHIWGREDSFMLDKIVINKSSTAPEGLGPEESPLE